MKEVITKDAIIALLEFIGENVEREGLRETPTRVFKAWSEWTSGYNVDTSTIFKDFGDGAEDYDQMIQLDSIPFYSHCVIGSTFIETPKGRIPICRLKDGDWIYTMNPKTMELQLAKCENPRITQKQAKLVAIHTDNDTLICTPNHRILLTSGEWCEAQNLKNGDRLASLYRSASASGEKGKYYSHLITSRYSRHENGIKINGESRSVPEHRFVNSFQNSIDSTDGRKHPIHHKNEELWDNSPKNLQSMTISQHNTAHERTLKLANNQNRKDAAAIASGKKEVREKRSISVKKYWCNLKLNKEAYKNRCQLTSEGIQEARNHTVIGVQQLNYTEDVWCMNVPGTELFFANGIAVHNCEHHLAAIFGHISISYIPGGRIAGLSKFCRLVDAYAKRLQVQERMTRQIADDIQKYLNPLGVGVVVQARHFCMESRGICKPGVITTTKALRGCFKTEPETRAEFYASIKGQ